MLTTMIQEPKAPIQPEKQNHRGDCLIIVRNRTAKPYST